MRVAVRIVAMVLIGMVATSMTGCSSSSGAPAAAALDRKLAGMAGVSAVDPTYRPSGFETPQRYDPVVELRPDITPDELEAVVRTAVEGRRDPALVEIGGNWVLQLSSSRGQPGWTYPPTFEIQQFTTKTAAAVADEAVVAAARAWLGFAGRRGGPTAIAIPGTGGARADLKIADTSSGAATLDEAWAYLAAAEPIPVAAGLRLQVAVDNSTEESTYSGPTQPAERARQSMSALDTAYTRCGRQLDVEWFADGSLDVSVTLGRAGEPPADESIVDRDVQTFRSVLDGSGPPYRLKITYRQVPVLEIDHRTR